MIKFEHSVFALPFALTGALAGDSFRHVGFISCVVFLGENSLDCFGDGGGALGRHGVQPPGGCRYRRAQSAHAHAAPAGRTAGAGIRLGFVIVSSAVFVFAAGELNPLCLHLAPLALAIVFVYSFTKRFTAFSHLVLGFSLGIAPAAAWIAMRGSLDPRILWLTAAVTFWTAGFDIIYSCQDYEFDQAEELFSVPRLFGIAGALRVAQFLHVLMVACLLMLVHHCTSELSRWPASRPLWRCWSTNTAW